MTVPGPTFADVIEAVRVLNPKRVCIYTGVLFLWGLVVGFVFGFIGGVLRGAGFEIPSWLLVLQAVTGFVVAVGVFARLAIVQPNQTYEHGVAVGILAWLVSFFPDVLWLGESGHFSGKSPFSLWMGSIVYSMVSMVIGVPLGRLVRTRRDRAHE